MKRFFAMLMAVVLVLSAAFCFTGSSKSVLSNTINISADNVSYEISDKLYGISLDDSAFEINSSLVGNLINDGSFELTERPYSAWNCNYHFGVADAIGVNGEQTKVGAINTIEGTSIKNVGYDEDFEKSEYFISKASSGNMKFVEGETYVLTAYFKNVSFEGTLEVYITGRGNIEKYPVDISNCTDWTKITLEIVSESTSIGSLAMDFVGSGLVHFDNFSLVPKSSYGYGTETWKNVTLNAEMVNALKELSPAFIRFSEYFYLDRGNGVHGWKDSLGAVYNRTPAFEMLNDETGYYDNSNEMGFYEYLLLCEDLGAEAIPEFNIGVINEYADQYTETLETYANGEMSDGLWNLYVEKLSVKNDTEIFKEIVQNILDMLEYATGDVTTEWGAKRAEDGHPEPFDLNYISLGKYNIGKTYWENFTSAYRAIKEKYPDLQVISAFDEELDSQDFKDDMTKVNSIYKNVLVNESFVKVNSLYENLERYDGYERVGAKIVVDEFDSKADGIGKGVTRNNIWSALENSAFLLSLEKNSDIVMMASDRYAIANSDISKDKNALIWTNDDSILLTADYYAQMILANNTGTNYITTDFDMSGEGIYHSATVDTENQVVYVKVVNTTNKAQTLDVQLDGFENAKNPTVQYMSEKFKSACNKFDEQLHVAPSEETLTIENNTVSYYMNSYSVSVIRIPYGENDGSALYTLPEMDVVSPYMHPAISIVVPCVLAVLVVGVGVVILVVRIKHHKKAKKKDEE